MPDTRTRETMSEAFNEMHDSPLVETDFGRLAEKVHSRRGFLSGGAALAASAFVLSTEVLRPLSALANANRFGFEAVAANGLDTVTVPKGYGWHAVRNGATRCGRYVEGGDNADLLEAGKLK